MQDTGNHSIDTQNASQGHTGPHRRIRVTHWRPIPLTATLQKLFVYPASYTQGHAYMFTTDAFRDPISERRQIGYVWAGKHQVVVRWRGKGHRFTNAEPLWPAVERIINDHRDT